ncbi:unnamed protein product [Tetraodon nigroviridis]|uniref:(spotted green pufferfish) hypothetical protein n=1 Tax=Tetraodon nigroviridis TaxID=99883 RepID=Q4SGD0_TETNG|nr:unnamed protein product [Tetraodon nigroviridis]
MGIVKPVQLCHKCTGEITYYNSTEGMERGFIGMDHAVSHWLLEREPLVKTSIRGEESWLRRLRPRNQRKVCLLLPAMETSRRGVGVVTIAK